MYNVIPSEVVLLLELRDLDPVRVEHFTEELKLYGSVEEELKPFGIEFELQVDKPSRMLDGAVINAISEVCQKEPQIRSVTMSSGAGHDSKEIIYRVPAGMIFVPPFAQGIYDGGSDRKGNQGVVSDTDSYGQNEVGERK